MKKFEITWYRVLLGGKREILDTKIVEAEHIDDIDGTQILPPNAFKIYYVRKAFIGSTQRWLDYGSHTRFIEINEVVDKPDLM